MKMSNRGNEIYALIMQSDGHMTAEEIHTELKKKQIQMGLATIYRNLNNLFSLGVINRVRHPELGYIYDKNKHDHYHFYDIETKKIYDLDIEYQQELDQLVEKAFGEKVKSHSIIFEGIFNKEDKE